jgi:hypothetical protein
MCYAALLGTTNQSTFIFLVACCLKRVSALYLLCMTTYHHRQRYCASDEYVRSSGENHYIPHYVRDATLRFGTIRDSSPDQDPMPSYIRILTTTTVKCLLLNTHSVASIGHHRTHARHISKHDEVEVSQLLARFALYI